MLAALMEDPGLVPAPMRQLTARCNLSSREPTSSSGFSVLLYAFHTHKLVQVNTYTY